MRKLYGIINQTKTKNKKKLFVRIIFRKSLSKIRVLQLKLLLKLINKKQKMDITFTIDKLSVKYRSHKISID